jgi:hypothetical protein
MAEWGRKEYSKAWPSRTPVWTWTAIFLSLLFLAGAVITPNRTVAPTAFRDPVIRAATIQARRAPTTMGGTSKPVAFYQSSTHLSQLTHAEFDKTHSPGERTSCSGIYRCRGCGREIVHTTDKSLPPQNHHQHTLRRRFDRWQSTSASGWAAESGNCGTRRAGTKHTWLSCGFGEDLHQPT